MNKPNPEQPNFRGKRKAYMLDCDTIRNGNQEQSYACILYNGGTAADLDIIVAYPYDLNAQTSLSLLPSGESPCSKRVHDDFAKRLREQNYYAKLDVHYHTHILFSGQNFKTSPAEISIYHDDFDIEKYRFSQFERHHDKAGELEEFCQFSRQVQKRRPFHRQKSEGFSPSRIFCYEATMVMQEAIGARARKDDAALIYKQNAKRIIVAPPRDRDIINFTQPRYSDFDLFNGCQMLILGETGKPLYTADQTKRLSTMIQNQKMPQRAYSL